MTKLHKPISRNGIFIWKSRFIFQALLCLIILNAFFFSCSKEKVEAPNAVSELILDLKSKNPGCTCEPFINQYAWRNENVYVLAYKGPACDWFPTFYYSNGQKFTLAPDYSYQTFRQESSLAKTVWSCK